MCGIVGYVGKNEAVDILISGLEKLEYRGYDSAGVYINNNEQGYLMKEVGRVSKLKDKVQSLGYKVEGHSGIGHTRWATHGGVTEANAHPHVSDNQRFYLVHNGVIENYKNLSETYLKDISLKSQTDTEVAVQLIQYFVEKENMSTLDALKKMIAQLENTSAYAFLLIDNENPDVLYAAKKRSPLLIGVGDAENVVTSDAAALLNVTNKFIDLMDDEIAVISADTVHIFDQNNVEIVREPFELEISEDDTDKGVYPFYMLKEIDEQAIVTRKLEQYYYTADGVIQNIDPKLIESLKQADRIYIVAAGTSYHAGLVGAQYFEKWAGIPTEVHISSEFAYNMPLLSEKPFFIFLSQSGETADSREVLQIVSQMNYPTLTISNVINSTLIREADFGLPLMAGPEIAVASTKAYTAQILVQAILVDSFNKLDFNLREELTIIANNIQSIVDQKEVFENIAKNALTDKHSAFYIGRGLDAFVALEAALKLKEISYIQTEGFAAGELKHGTISLIENGTPVFALITQSKTAGLVRSNIEETIARGANAVIISTEGLNKADDAFVLPKTNELLMPILSVIPTQLIAYYASLQLGLDVDKPRNLAKSVTVQ